MSVDEICSLSLHELSGSIRSRALSPVEVTEAHLVRIETLNPKINAFTTVCAEEALEAEAEIGCGHHRGPLHGIPFGAKDIFDTAGVRTKPTYGRVSVRGVFPHAPTLDHVGSFGRTVRDCGLFLQGMAGYDPLDSTSRDVPVPDFCAEILGGVQGMRLGLCPDLVRVELDAAVERAFHEAVEIFRRLGAKVEMVRFPPAERIEEAYWNIMCAEFHEVHAARMAENPDGYNESLKEHFEKGSRVRPDDYMCARREQELIRRSAIDLFRKVDALLLPVFACAAALIETNMARINRKEFPWFSVALALTSPHNLTGFPALAIPTGLNDEGLPVAMQIVGPPWGEARVLRVAHAHEQATPEIRSRRPPLD
jgi:aspartyl-tRNA(Asn)/glutamyl-tRNA(Gln) amidotransferase subunit A